MKSAGIIIADPNPVHVLEDDAPGATVISWTALGVNEVEVRVGAPDGQLLSRAGSCGSVATGLWVSDGMTFYLQNVSDGLSLTPDNTLAKVVVRTIGPTDQARRGAQGRKDEDTPPVGGVNFGDLRRLTPISRRWGTDRGRPIDRYYIENFLAANSADIRGRALAIGDDGYTRMFGGDRVTQSDVLHVEDNPLATIVGDLTDAPHIPSDAFDCVICPQTLQLIYDTRAAIRTMHRILKPGGVLLATFPGISQTYDQEWKNFWCWNFTPLSARRLFDETFSPSDVTVEAHGNVLSAISFLLGLAVHELTEDELNYHEPGYEIAITVRAVKATSNVK